MEKNWLVYKIEQGGTVWCVPVLKKHYPSRRTLRGRRSIIKNNLGMQEAKNFTKILNRFR